MKDCKGQEVNLDDLVIVVQRGYKAYGKAGRIVQKNKEDGTPCVWLVWANGERSPVPWYGDEICLAEPEDLI